MPNDTSPNRTYEQLPDTVIGTDGGGNPVAQPVSVNAAYPGIQVIKVTNGVLEMNVPPYGGQLVLIDARASTNDVLVRSKPSTNAILPSEQLANVLAGTYGLVLSDGSGWRSVPDAGTDSGKSTLTSALARGLVDVNVPALAAFAVTGGGRDGITYREDDLVILTAQTAPAENGPYYVGAVAAGNAPLIRPSWWAHGSIIPESFTFRLSIEGATYGGFVLTTNVVAQKVVDTDDPLIVMVPKMITAFTITGAGGGGVLSAVAPVGSVAIGARNGAGDYQVTLPATGVPNAKMSVSSCALVSGDAHGTLNSTSNTSKNVQTWNGGGLADGISVNFQIWRTLL